MLTTRYHKVYVVMIMSYNDALAQDLTKVADIENDSDSWAFYPQLSAYQ